MKLAILSKCLLSWQVSHRFSRQVEAKFGAMAVLIMIFYLESKIMLL